jgi:2-haloacid dehalogenase
MKKAIVFDFGGVLIDWSPYHLYRKILPNDQAIKSFLDEIDFFTINSRIDAGMSLEQWAGEYSQKFPQYRSLIEAFHTRWTESNGEVIGDSLDIVREVKAKGYAVYGLSNWSAETFPLVKDRFGFLQELDDYLLSGMVGQIKPGEEIFRSFLERIDRPADECVFIDDNAANIETASRLGFTGILFKSPQQLRTELNGMGILGTNGHH